MRARSMPRTSHAEGDGDDAEGDGADDDGD
jgi:hypothetical protein